MTNKIKKNILSLATIALFTVSCTQTKEIKPTILEGETAAASTDAAASNEGATIVASNPGAVVDGKQVSAPAAGISGMNPEHGKPGHRCDISVGAPLNSPPGNTSTPAPQQPVAPVAAPNATPAPVENPMNLAVNPAHGEPGHSCAIAVGAPFK